jgi:hypothetical protein
MDEPQEGKFSSSCISSKIMLPQRRASLKVPLHWCIIITTGSAAKTALDVGIGNLHCLS